MPSQPISPSFDERMRAQRQQAEAEARVRFTQFDLVAIKALRPGAPEAELRSIFGMYWTPRLPASQGYFFDFSAAGLILRLDTSARLGSVTFAQVLLPVAGLEPLTALAAIQAVYTSLERVPENSRFGFFSLVQPTPDGHQLSLRFNKEQQLISVNFAAPDARYLTGEERMPTAAGLYPPPSGEPGSPFADTNLKLAVLSELLEHGHLTLGTPEQLAEHVLDRKVDLDKEGYDLLKPVYDYLARYPLTPAQLALVTELVLDGGSAIYPYVFYFWDGEGGEFDIHSFAGIEACVNLKRVDGEVLVADDAGLRALEARLAASA